MRPATGLRDLEWNNVRALIETGGSMWQNRATSQASYEVPKAVASAPLRWCPRMGGISPDQQLKLAACVSARATTSGQAHDNDGAEVDATTCDQYDNFFISTRWTPSAPPVLRLCQRPECDLEEQFPNGYSIPSYFFDYPAHGIRH